jgi:hypothetical protein
MGLGPASSVYVAFTAAIHAQELHHLRPTAVKTLARQKPVIRLYYMRAHIEGKENIFFVNRKKVTPLGV